MARRALEKGRGRRKGTAGCVEPIKSGSADAVLNMAETLRVRCFCLDRSDVGRTSGSSIRSPFNAWTRIAGRSSEVCFEGISGRGSGVSNTLILWIPREFSAAVSQICAMIERRTWSVLLILKLNKYSPLCNTVLCSSASLFLEYPNRRKPLTVYYWSPRRIERGACLATDRSPCECPLHTGH